MDIKIKLDEIKKLTRKIKELKHKNESKIRREVYEIRRYHTTAPGNGTYTFKEVKQFQFGNEN
jgi:hypothetical protein